MIKSLGIFLILTSILSLIAAGMMNSSVIDNTEITGNVLSNIITQPSVKIGAFSYLEGAVISYSIVSLIMGAIFLFRI